MVYRGLDAPDSCGTVSGPDAATAVSLNPHIPGAGVRRKRPTHISRCGRVSISRSPS